MYNLAFCSFSFRSKCLILVLRHSSVNRHALESDKIEFEFCSVTYWLCLSTLDDLTRSQFLPYSICFVSIKCCMNRSHHCSLSQHSFLIFNNLSLWFISFKCFFINIVLQKCKAFCPVPSLALPSLQQVLHLGKILHASRNFSQSSHLALSLQSIISLFSKKTYVKALAWGS